MNTIYQILLFFFIWFANPVSATKASKEIVSPGFSLFVENLDDFSGSTLFSEYILNGFKINASTLDDAFKHVDNFVPNGADKPTFSSNRLVGCHNEINFNAQRVSNGGRIEVISETPSGVAGVKNIEYKTLQADNAGNPIAGQYVKNGETHIKTVYDPNIYPEASMKDLGYKAFKDAMDKNNFDVIDPLTNEVIPRTFKGVANGRTVMGHYKTVNGENIISSWWIIQ